MTRYGPSPCTQVTSVKYPTSASSKSPTRLKKARISTIETYDYGDSRGSIPSIGIRFVGPTEEWRTVGDKPRKADLKKDPILEKENAISVLAKDSERILEALQHLQEFCQPVDAG